MTASATSPLLKVDSLARTYVQKRKTTHAVKDVSFEIDHGEIVCVLGPNGAGKTTTIRMIATLLEPSSGRIELSGVDIISRPKFARERTGLVLGGDRGFYMRSSAAENLQFFGELQAVPRKGRRERIAEVLERVGLAKHGSDPVERFSRGMRQRLHIARALLAEPELILLDEPSIGIDAQGARELRGIVRDLRSNGTGILLTTHYMQEAEELADRVVVIDAGTVVASGNVADIAVEAKLTGVSSFRARALTPELESALRAIEGVATVVAAEGHGGWQIDLAWSRVSPHSDFADAWDLEPVGVRRPTLEESYLAFLENRRTPAKSGEGA